MWELQQSDKENRERWLEMCANTSDVYFELSEYGEILEISDATTLISGYGKEELIGRSFFDLFAYEHNAKEYFLKEIRSQADLRDHEITLCAKDGMQVQLLINRVLQRRNGRIVLIARDITGYKQLLQDRAEYEAIVNAVFESCDDLIWTVKGGENMLVGFNRAARIYFKERYGVSLKKHMSPENMFDGNQAFWERFYKDTVKYGKCFEMWEDQNRDQTFEMRGYLMMYGDQTWAISMFLKDVTQTVKNTRYMELLNQDLERCAKERVREMEDAYRELDRFTHTVSHEFKTPLRAIEAYNQILREEEWDKLDEEGCQAVNEIARLCDNTLHMINSLLEHSKMKFRQLQLGLVDMNRLVEEVFQEIVVVKQGEKPKLIQYHLPYAVADEFLMKQVIYNIFSNSIKFAKAGETAVLTVGAIPEKQQNTYYFADNGVGFDMKYSGKLFTMFNRLHSSSEYEGSGIGLYTIKYIVEKHGGTVFIESEENKGCVIGFSLPK